MPVACSDQSLPAEIITEYKLGTVFRSGDPASLVRAAPAEIEPVNLERVRAERSNRATAQQALEAIASVIGDRHFHRRADQRV